MTNFIKLTKEEFEKCLYDDFKIIQTNAKEYVYQGPTQKKNIAIRTLSGNVITMAVYTNGQKQYNIKTGRQILH